MQMRSGWLRLPQRTQCQGRHGIDTVSVNERNKLTMLRRTSGRL